MCLFIFQNCKTRPTGDTNRDTSNEDTAEDNNQKFCNGSPEAKRRRKGKQPIPAAKIAKVATTVMTSPAAKLQPIGIIIPQALDEPKEEGVLGIPNMDSPLFKDIPRKKVESSSDSSSSSTSEENSSDDSTSSDDSDIEEEESKDTEINSTVPKIDLLEEQITPRIPIKLTISNFGKPSVKTPSASSSSSKNISDNNNFTSDLDIDNKNPEVKAAFQVDPEDAKHSPEESSTNTYQHCNENEAFFKQVNNTNISHLGNGHLVNNSQRKNHAHPAEAADDTSMDVDLIYNTCLSYKKSDNSKRNSQTTNSLDQPIRENYNYKMKDVAESSNPAVPILSKQMLRPLSIHKKEGEELESHTLQTREILSTDTESLVRSLPVSLKFLPASVRPLTASPPGPEGPLTIFTKQQSAEEELAKAKIDSSFSRDSFQTKYDQDDIILASTPSAVQHNLKTTCKLTPEALNSVPSLDSRDNSNVEGKYSLETATECETEAHNSVKSDNTQKASEAGKLTLQNDCILNVPKDITSSKQFGKQNKILENESSDKVLLVENIDISEVKDEKLDMNDINFADKNLSTKMDKNSDKYISIKMEKELLRVFDKKVPAKTPSGSTCKDTTVSSHSSISNTSTSTTTSVTTSIANTTSLNSTSGTHTAIGGFTYGIPDSKNPFITWTKYDDDDDSSLNVTTTLPAPLVPAPFPHLPLPGDVPIARISPLGVSVPHLSTLGLTPMSSGSGQLMRSSPGRQDISADCPGLRSSPNSNAVQQLTSLSDLQAVHAGSSDSTQATHGDVEKDKTSQKRYFSFLHNSYCYITHVAKFRDLKIGPLLVNGYGC